MTSIDQSDKIKLEKLLIASLNQEKGEEMMTSLAQSWKEEGIEIGRQAGIKLGETKGKAELIKMMLSKGNSVEAISKITGLSMSDIQRLKS